MSQKIIKSDSEWQSLLTPQQYHVTREKGTEPAFTGKYWDCHDQGVFVCVCCGTPLFDSTRKFDSGCGWPSFTAPQEAAHVIESADLSHGMRRTEVLCSSCDAHLGHVFPDGPGPDGLRYCINSASLKLEKSGRYNSPMKFLFDLFPVILFFASFKIAEGRPQAAADLIIPILGAIGLDASVSLQQAPILLATLVVILATAMQIGWVWLRHGKVDKMLWISLVLVAFFGSLTLIFHDETFIKWKPTVLYWVFACVLLFSATILKKNLIRGMLEEQVQLPDPLWQKLNLAWTFFFALMGVLNLLVAFAFDFSTAVWVNFKLFGSMGLMLIFIIVQSIFLAKYIEEK